MGRDAADASIATVFGLASCTQIEVTCEVTDPDYKPWTHRKSVLQGLSLDG
jgi:hypothetical protein